MAPITEATRPATGAEPALPGYEEFYGAMEAKDIDTVCGMCTEDTRIYVDLWFAGAEGGGAQ